MISSFYINKFLINENRTKEDYQNIITKETKINCEKSNYCINLRHNILLNIKNPNKYNDGFDYSPKFKYIQLIKDKIIYINIIDNSNNYYQYKELYRFIEGQLNISNNYIYFANIIDDNNEIHKHISKFNYLLSLEKYKNIKNNVFIGNIDDYINWFYFV